MVKHGFMTIQHGSDPLGTLEMSLYDDVVPFTVKNFVSLLEGSRAEELGRYKLSTFHRLIKGFMIQGGEDVGGKEEYSFRDENFVRQHTRRGTLSMANSGPNSNGSQFFITFRKKTPHLDGKHVVFGHVADHSLPILDRLEQIQTNRSDDKPTIPITIMDCGLMKQNTEEETAIKATAQELQATTPEGREKQDSIDTSSVFKDSYKTSNNLQASQENNTITNNKNNSIKARLQKLKMKMNQARQLNRQAVISEGEKVSCVDGMIKEQKKQQHQQKQSQKEEWEQNNAHAIQLAAKNSVAIIGTTTTTNNDSKTVLDAAKALVTPAMDSMKKAARKLEKQEMNRFGMNDYYNPEGQHRNYVRNLKSIPQQQLAESSAAAQGVYDPTMDNYNDHTNSERQEQKEREGARRLAKELHRRIDKQQTKKRERMDFEQTDVTYINARNKRFNEKISRNYDSHTAEIRQNLERGTAL